MNRGTKPEFVLVVEDRSDDVLLLERAWSRAGMKLPLRFVNDGKSAIDFLQSQGGNGQVAAEFIKAVILDLKMPGLDGFDVLKWIRHEATLKDLFVVVFSSSFNPADIHRAYALGANSYLVKSETFDELIDMMQRFEPSEPVAPDQLKQPAPAPEIQSRTLT
jgi:CheY-like chemotaxis protein